MIEDFQSDGIESLDSEGDPRHLIAAGPQLPEGPDALLGFIFFSGVQHSLAPAGITGVSHIYDLLFYCE